VSLRAAPDTMTYLTALLPVAQGVAAYTALTRAADTARATGDEERPRGQVMADTLVERLTGQVNAADVPLEVNLVVTDQSLLGDPDHPSQSGQSGQPTAQQPVEVLGYGPVPAPLARQWIASTAGAGADTGTDTDDATQAWIRRLFTSPDGTRLVDMDTKHRTFPARLRRFIDLRDRRCRTPWCDAPIRHGDHPLRVADGGRSSELNSQGLCEACNYAKEATGWRARAKPGGLIETTTPTGHRYRSSQPPPIGYRTPPAAFDELDLIVEPDLDDYADLDNTPPTRLDRLLDKIAGTSASCPPAPGTRACGRHPVACELKPTTWRNT